MRPLLLRWLGRMAYATGVELQQETVSRRRRDEIPDTLMLLEHPPVITLGRGADRSNVVAATKELARRGIEVHDSGRGGDVTYHGPGQLVGYPVLALEADRRDAHRYLRDLEQALIDAVAEYGVQGTRVPGLTGVWVGRRKLAAIGVRLSTGWITSHGFALNVAPDLDGFGLIVPCGIEGRGVVSLSELTQHDHDLREVAGVVARCLAKVFERRCIASERPDERLANPPPEEVSS